MDDNTEKEKQRPNANYRLSNENTTGEEIVYHYNRDRRLAKAPKSVQDLYKEGPRRKSGFFRSLVGTKPKAMLFSTIMIVSVMIVLISVFGLASDTHELEGNTLSIQGIRYEDLVIISIKKTLKKDTPLQRGRAYTGAVNIGISPVIKSGQEQNMGAGDIFFHKIFFTNESVENYSFAVPFDQEELALVFQTEKKTLSLTIKPE